MSSYGKRHGKVYAIYIDHLCISCWYFRSQTYAKLMIIKSGHDFFTVIWLIKCAKRIYRAFLLISSALAFASSPRTDHPRCAGRFAGFCQTREECIRGHSFFRFYSDWCRYFVWSIIVSTRMAKALWGPLSRTLCLEQELVWKRINCVGRIKM